VSNRASRITGVVLTLGLTGMALMFLAFVMDEYRAGMSDTGPAPIPVVPMLALAIGGAMFIALVRGPIGKAVGRMFEAPTDDSGNQRIDQVEDRLHELSIDSQRFAELEERVDFAERMLASRPIKQFERMDTPV
jgi:hypothetical protein